MNLLALSTQRDIMDPVEEAAFVIGIDRPVHRQSLEP